MTLHFTLHVNDRSIDEGMTVRRTAPGQPESDDVNLYVVQAKCDGAWHTFTVEHRYGDGPWELVRKALNAIASTKECARQCGAPGCQSWGCAR